MWRLKHWSTRRLTRYPREKVRHFGETAGDVKPGALLDTLADTLAQAEDKMLAIKLVRCRARD